MEVAIRAWGNSRGITIPKEVLTQLDLKVADILDIEVENNSIILHKQFKHMTFEERMAQYNDKISVCDFDWGEPKGRELL